MQYSMLWDLHSNFGVQTNWLVGLLETWMVLLHIGNDNESFCFVIWALDWCQVEQKSARRALPY